MGHERSAGINIGGREFNVSSKTGRILGAPDEQKGFKTRKAAKKAAKRRSRSFDVHGGRSTVNAKIEDAPVEGKMRFVQLRKAKLAALKSFRNP